LGCACGRGGRGGSSSVLTELIERYIGKRTEYPLAESPGHKNIKKSGLKG